MGAQTVLTIDGDVAKLIAKQDQVVRKLQEQNKELRALGKTSKETAADAEGIGEGFTTSILKMAGGIATLTGAIALLTKGVQESKKARDEAAAITETMDISQRKMLAQFDIPEPAARQGLIDKINRVAESTGTKPQVAYKKAGKLSQAGVPLEDVPGNLEILLKAERTLPEDEKLEVPLISRYLKTQGKGVTRENIQNLIQRAAGLSRGSQFQLNDVGEMIEWGATAKEVGMSEEVSFSVQAIMKSAGGSEGLKPFLGKLLNPRGMSKQEVDQLSLMKLKPEDISLAHHSFQQVIRNLAQGRENLPKDQQPGAFVGLFGDRGKEIAETLVAHEPELETYGRLQREGARIQAYREDITQAGPGMETLRSETRSEIRNFIPRAERMKTMLTEYDKYIDARVAGGQEDWLAGWTNKKTFHVAAAVGADVRREISGDDPGIRKSMGDLQDALKENTATTRANTDVTKGQTTTSRNGPTE